MRAYHQLSPVHRSLSTCGPSDHQLLLQVGSGTSLNFSSSEYEDVDALAPRSSQTAGTRRQKLAYSTSIGLFCIGRMVAPQAVHLTSREAVNSAVNRMSLFLRTFLDLLAREW